MLIACSETPSGPERPIDGTWAVTGIFTDLDGVARCRLTGEVTIITPANGSWIISGNGTHTLDCISDGVPHLLTGGSAFVNSRFVDGRDLSIQFGDCSLGAQYEATQSHQMKGNGVCQAFFSNFFTPGLIGSWQGDRLEGP